MGMLFAPGASGGVAIGVVKHGVRRVVAYGTARSDSIFQIASITKTLTGLLLAQIVVQDRVGLNGLYEPVLSASATFNGAAISLYGPAFPLT